MPNQKFTVRPAGSRPKLFTRSKSASFEARSRTTFDGSSRASMDPINRHKTIHVNSTAREALDLDGMRARAKAQLTLKEPYKIFCILVDGLEERYSGRVPTEAGALSEFTGELMTRAWHCLVENTYSIGGIFVPNLVFARCDHLTPEAFVASLDEETHALYRRILHAEYTRDKSFAGHHSIVWRRACDRIAAEAHLHRPIAELFAEVADAR